MKTRQKKTKQTSSTTAGPLDRSLRVAFPVPKSSLFDEPPLLCLGAMASVRDFWIKDWLNIQDSGIQIQNSISCTCKQSYSCYIEFITPSPSKAIKCSNFTRLKPRKIT